MSLAPIVIFCYNRPNHLSQVLLALKNNHLADQSELIVFCDGPKRYLKEEDRINLEKVAMICEQIKGFKSVKVNTAETNMGLKKSVIEGLNKVFTDYNKAIILEDDLVSDPYFLTFMNEALELYENNDEVACISGYIYPVRKTLPETFFLKGADCWGWATWKRAWTHFEEDGSKLLSKLESNKLLYDYDFYNTYPYGQMLRDQIANKNNSWAILWYASAYLKDMLCLYPSYSLIQNIGNDGSGTHAGNTDKFDSKLQNKKLFFEKIDLKENTKAKLIIAEHFKSLFKKEKLSLRSLLKSITPEFLLKTVRKLKTQNTVESKTFGWFGNYSNWAEVSSKSEGYNKEEILEKVKQALTQVHLGKAAYERDSVCFEKLEYSSSLLQSLKRIAQQCSNKLFLIDFGGSLGSTYFQYKKALQTYEIKWHVVEQEHFVKCGNENFKNSELTFYNSIEESEIIAKSDLLLLSSVLAYLPEPHSFIRTIVKFKFKYIILYRTAFIEGTSDRLTLQIVPPQIYKASYPAWFFNEEKLLSLLSDEYIIESSFPGDIETELDLNGQKAYWKGFVLKHK